MTESKCIFFAFYASVWQEPKQAQNNNSVSAKFQFIFTNFFNENNKHVTEGYFTSSDVAVRKSLKNIRN